MTWKELKNKKYWKIATNKYVLISAVFVVWILFFDASAWLGPQRDLDQQISEKEQTKAFYKKGIAADKKRIKQLQDSSGIEKFGRERYLMKKENEEVYIIEYTDSVKKNDHE